jgi:NADH-quinone oxidoreductase subunit M
MFIGIFERGVEIGFIIAIIGVFATFLTVVYTFWPIKRVFFGQASSEFNLDKKEPLTMIAPLFILASTSILFGVYPDIIVRLLTHLLT